MKRSWVLLMGCVLLQLLLARLMPSPWWVPDLLAAGLLLAILRVPGWWLMFSAFAATCTVVWSVRHAAPLFASWILVGGAIRLLMDRWHMEEPRAQMVIVGFISLAMMACAVWMDNLWSFEQVGWMSLRAILTALMLPLVRQV